MLAVGAIALLAGHTWGLLVALSSHVPLVGRIWPAITHLTGHASSGVTSDGAVTTGAVAVILVTAVPVVMLSMLLFPRLVAHLMPGASPRMHAWAQAGVALALGASLVLPAVLS